MRRERCIVLLPLLAAQHFGPLHVHEDAPAPALTVELLGLDEPVLSSITPTISIRANYVVDDPPPVVLGVRASLSSLVLDRIILDTFVVATDSAQIRLLRPLPSGTTLYFRSYARTAEGNEVLSFPSPPRVVPRWLTLVFPNAPAGAILDDQRPTFVWSSARVAAPPGPWRYDFSVANTAGGPPIFSATTTDTTATIPFPLEFNTSYRWAVTATLQDQSNERVTSTSSFVIVDETIPRTTLLYQPFPSPFPSPIIQFACIWFDLAERSTVTIDILDIRAFRVKRVFPEPGASAIPLEPGKYGRAVSTESGCTQQFIWDGTDEGGRRVIPGAYMVRMRAGRREFTKHIVFRG
jgi:hypothetical protein